MKKITIFLLLAVFFAKPKDTNAQDDKFKALFVYNITKMVDWPAAQKNGNFVVCVLGNADLQSISDKKVVNQVISLRKIASPAEIGDCHILYISADAVGSLGAAVSAVGGKPILIFADEVGASKKGAGINFITKDGSIKYEYSKKSIEKQGLSVSSDFESLGINVD